MRRILALLVAAACGVIVCGSASAGIRFGVADSTPMGANDGGNSFFGMLNDLGMTQDRVTVTWDPSQPTTILNEAGIDRMLAQAKAHGIDVIFSVNPATPRALAAPARPAQFATFLQIVATRFPQVRTVVIGNEFNQPKFFQPQFSASCARTAGGEYLRLLARSYDALKAIDPSLRVISSVSPRGNDDCRAKDNRSTSPVRFIHDMGVAYRSLHRQKPVFDEFGIHIYPRQPVDSIARGYQWPKIGFSNLDRLKQAEWDAFHGTAQTVPGWQAFRFGGAVGALAVPKIWIGEIGWEVAIPLASQGAYHGREAVHVTTEAAQAQIYADLVRLASCDPSIDSMLYFNLIDERSLDRFQSGLVRADGTKRASYGTVKSAIAATGGRCTGPTVSWKPASSVVGAGVKWGKLRRQPIRQTWWGFNTTAGEDAAYVAGIFRAKSRQLSDTERDRLQRALVTRSGTVLSDQGKVKANWLPLVRFPARRLAAGRYVYAIRLAADMNPERTSFFVSPPFRVGGAGR